MIDGESLGEIVIRTLLALDGVLIRGALAFVLATHDDIDVVAEVARTEDIAPAMWAHRPDVAVVDHDLFDGSGRSDRETWPEQSCPVLVLASSRRARRLGKALRSRSPRIGLLGNDVAPDRVVEAVRRLYQGQPVVDGGLVAAALSAANPLTTREIEILEVAARGWPIAEIAAKLSLSPGTVRNHLSRIAGKVGARTRIESVRIAQEAGWI